MTSYKKNIIMFDVNSVIFLPPYSMEDTASNSPVAHSMICKKYGPQHNLNSNRRAPRPGVKARFFGSLNFQC